MTQKTDVNPADSNPAGKKELDDQARYQATRNVTVIGAIVNTILAVTKISVGYLGQSQALIADGLHSLSDLASDIAIIYAAKQGSRAADENHPYGHGRIETLFTVLLGLFLIIVAAGILIDSIFRMLDPDKLLQPGFAAMGVALISVLANEALYQYTHRVAKRISSKLVEANAWHHRTDGISSIIVLIGIGGSMMGIRYLDALAAVGMALLIIKIGWRICLENTQELVDTGLSPDRVAEITDKINAVAGVVHMHTLRTRRVGNFAFVDVHIQVAPKLSVSEGHFISEQ
ncbi:MAG: cation diffusion facilitator family transporter, partial [Thiohalomonadales bacterium]